MEAVFTVHRYLFDKIHKGFLSTSDNEIKMHVQKSCMNVGHMHDFYEIELIVSGSTDEIINGKQIKASEGDIFLITPETYHALENEKDLSLISIAVTANFTNIDLLNNVVGINDDDKVFHKKLTKADYAFVISLFDRMEESIRNENPYNSQIAKSCVNLIISFILGNEETGVKLSQNISVIKNAMLYIRNNYANNPTLGEVAKHVNISKNYFSVLFKENAGISFKQFLNDVKLNNAAKKLKYSDLPIVEICHECGYDSLSTFYRKFKEKFSVSPQIYRQCNGKQK